MRRRKGEKEKKEKEEKMKIGNTLPSIVIVTTVLR